MTGGTYRFQAGRPGIVAGELCGVSARNATRLVTCFDLLRDEGSSGCHKDYFPFGEPAIIYPNMSLHQQLH